MSPTRRGISRRLGRLRDQVLASGARWAEPVIARLPRGGWAERFLLERQWAAIPAGMLERYLVSGYQNPRINVQSILLRHFLTDQLIADGLDELKDAELRLAVELNETLRLRALELGVTMGSYLNPRKHAAVRRVDEAIADRQDEYVNRWRELLENRQGPRISMLELACGSANDYRTFVDSGLGAHIDYRGIDLTVKNIENARRRFPNIAFEVGDVRDVQHPDRSFDFVVASDIFEHLSIDGMERTLSEAVRLARRGVALTFFNMADVADHIVTPRKTYFWNRLSRARIEERLLAEFDSVRVIPIAAWLSERFGYEHTYNTHAYSIFALREHGPAA
jgi:ubiquinone/menaquinone biosynthesis C-methylase UbiE